MVKSLFIVLAWILFSFSPSSASDVGVICSSEDEFKITTGDFILDFKPFTTEKRMALLYHQEHPDFCIRTLGQSGPSYNYFYWATRVDSIEENETTISIKVEGERQDYWNYTAFFTFFKSFPGLFRLKIVIDLQSEIYLIGGSPQFLCCRQDGGYRSNFRLAVRSNCHGFMPLIINVVDNAANYIFSTVWMELTGKESIYDVLKSGFDFRADDSSFGLLSPRGNVSPGNFISTDYLVYAWRDSLDNFSGIFAFLQAVTGMLGTQVQDEDYDASASMASSVIQSLLYPKHHDDVYASGGTGMGFKAFLGGGETRKEDTQFVTNVDVLLGAAYCYSRTTEGDAKALCELIVYNIDNFDGYYIHTKGFYGGGWNQTGYEPVDPWGFIGCPLMLISAHKLLPEVIAIDLDKLKSHAEQCIFMAEKINYDFPISIYPLTGEPDGGYGGDKKWDVCILYANLMVEMYKLVGDGKYLEKAGTALSHYMEYNYGKMCGSNTDVSGLSTAVALYKYTGDQIYLDYFKRLCYQLVRWLNLYRGTFVDKEIPFTCVSEGLGSYIDAFGRGLFRYFLEQPYDEALSLVNEQPQLANFFEPYFVLYDFYTTFAPYCARYSFPRILGLSDRQAEGGKIDGDYWIPIEDLRPVWHREPWEFTRGQQIYGAGSQIIDLMPGKFSSSPVEMKQEPKHQISAKCFLAQNYPNPFNSKTSIGYYLPTLSHVTFSIFDILGREVKTLTNESQQTGYSTAYWDGKNEQGCNVVSGMYLYRIQTENFIWKKKMLLLR